ncbi:MAG: sigma-70 family RNA polymerase sigma factor [Planctomyces sp.]|nr:sigma-70 family RNA polymerase sigma factor [Planctomyces sp.]
MTQTSPNHPCEQTSTCEIAELSDSVLVRRFVQDGDPVAFGEIVRRYSSLVLSVCRRVTGQTADAEDAFQATFLAMARRPRSVRNCRTVAGWLYAVAFRTAVHSVRLKRRTAMADLPEIPATSEPDPLEIIAASRDASVLDEELSLLPEKYRDVLVLTYFNGQTSQQIADQLHESKGVIDGRLRQARNMLRVRLARRSVAIGVVAVVASASTASASAASSELVNSTITLGTQALGYPVPDPVETSHLEPLIPAETIMISTKLIAGSLLSILAASVGFSAFGNLSAGDSNSGEAIVEQVAEGSASGEQSSAVNVQASSTSPEISVSRGAVVSSETAVSTQVNLPTVKDSVRAAVSHQRKVTEKINGALSETVSLQFSGKTQLADIIRLLNDELSHAIPGRTEVIQFDKSGLNAAGASSEEFSVEEINLEGVSMESALKFVLAQASVDGPGAKLDFIIRDELLLITTEEVADSELYTRVYDVEKILPLFRSEMFHTAEGSLNADGTSVTTSSVPAAGSQLIEAVTRLAEPDSWSSSGGSGECVAADRHLVVRQSRRGHRAVADILEQLSEVAVEL